MSHPHPDMPSIKMFVENATRQGCDERISRPVHGLKETIVKRYLIRTSPPIVAATLPSGDDDTFLTPGKLAELVRVLGVTGYEAPLIRHGYGPDGTGNPTH